MKRKTRTIMEVDSHTFNDLLFELFERGSGAGGHFRRTVMVAINRLENQGWATRVSFTLSNVADGFRVFDGLEYSLENENGVTSKSGHAGPHTLTKFESLNVVIASHGVCGVRAVYDTESLEELLETMMLMKM